MSHKTKITFIVAVLIIAIAQITWHFLPLPDFFDGLLVGIGFGMLLSMLGTKKKQ